MANLTPGQVYQKRGDFIWKNALIEHNSISLQAVCTKPTRVGHCCETPFCTKIELAGQLPLLQMFDLFFTGSWIVTFW